jgi:uncharacterized protein DUF4340
MKKEYILLLILIITLCSYLFFHNKNQTSSLLPEISIIDNAEIESIDIIKSNEIINCFKDNGNWVVTENKFPGDAGIFSEMIVSIKNLTITTLISEKDDLKRYDLDKDKSIKVIAKGEKGIVREFSIGKTAPTQKHTFITIDTNKGVFHASGNLRRKFNKSVDNLRDKQIQKLDQATIEIIEISKGSIRRAVSKTDDKNPETPWHSRDKKNLNTESITSLLETLADLKCSGYVDTQMGTDLKNKTSLLTIILKTGEESGQEYKIELFPKTEQKKYMGISSQNKYIFVLEDYVADSIISDTDKLLNIEAEKDNDGHS